MAKRIEELPLNYEELRSLVLESLKAKSVSDFFEFYSTVSQIAVEKGIIPNPYGKKNITTMNSFLLKVNDATRVQEILWDLIIEGIIRPGRDGMNTDLPDFHVTGYGLKVVNDVSYSPYDPDGYLKRLQSEIPDIDEIILIYLEESLHTFRIGCLLSSSVTLGCASEKALLLLINAYLNAMPEKMQSKFRKNTEGHFMKRQFDELIKMFNSHLKTYLPVDLKDLEIIIFGVYSMIRIYRNDSGHPTGKTIPREQAYANITVFPTYVKKVYDLIKWLHSDPAVLRDTL